VDVGGVVLRLVCAGWASGSGVDGRDSRWMSGRCVSLFGFSAGNELVVGSITAMHGPGRVGGRASKPPVAVFSSDILLSQLTNR
jgi:hypothetical protein